FYRLVLHYGFMEETDVPAALKDVPGCGAPFEMMQTSFFLSRQTLLSAETPGMARWREKLFAWMMRNSATPMEFFRLPTNRVVELGSQVELYGLGLSSSHPGCRRARSPAGECGRTAGR